MAQLVKNPPAIQETWVWSLGWEDPLEKGKATHSSLLAWRIPWTVQSMGSQRVRHDWATCTHSIVVAHGLSCSVAYGVFLDHRSNLCLQPWQILYHWATWEVPFHSSISHLLRALEEGNRMISLPICFRKITSHCLWPELLPKPDLPSCSVSLSLSSFTFYLSQHHKPVPRHAPPLFFRKLPWLEPSLVEHLSAPFS